VGRLLLAFILLPFLDLYLLVRLAGRVGGLPVLAWVLAAAVIGSALAKAEGLRVLRQWREAHARGQVPEEGLLGGVLALAGGVLLVLPGLVTDALGLFLVLPPTRRWVARLLRRRLERSIRAGHVRVVSTGSWGHVGQVNHSVRIETEPRVSSGPRLPSSATPRRDTDVVDAEVDAEVEQEAPPRRPPSSS